MPSVEDGVDKFDAEHEAPSIAGAQPGQHLDEESAATTPEREFTVRARTQRELIVRRFLQHKLAVISLAIFLLLVIASFLGQHIWHYSFDTLTGDYSKAPSLKHPFGTDDIGHDDLAKVLHGSEKSVSIALIVAVLSTVVGTIWGSVAGFYRGFVDSLLMRTVDLVLTIPSIAILALLAAKFGASSLGWLSIAFVLAGLIWAPIARVGRGVVLSLREKEYVEAARALGARDSRIIFRHLLPNALGPIIVNLTITVANAILLETALSYLGVGVQPPDTSLGLLVSEGQQAANTRPWLFYFPGLFIIVIALTINFIGDGLRDAFDPRQTRVRA
jgi:ABC-type dipeptide/oligopeptide/nickel transport system permease subunit